MKKLTTILRNLADKIDSSVNIDRITNNEIDALFGEASGTGTNSQDYVVEHGVSVFASDNTSWTYFKYASGVVDMWGYKSVASSSAYSTMTFGNNIYAYGHQTDMMYPFVLTGQPLVVPVATVGNAFTMSTVVDSTIYTNRVTIFGLGFYGGQQTGTQKFVARCHLIGLWK